MWTPKQNAERRKVSFETKHGIKYATILQRYTNYVHVSYMDGFDMFIPNDKICS